MHQRNRTVLIGVTHFIYSIANMVFFSFSEEAQIRFGCLNRSIFKVLQCVTMTRVVSLSLQWNMLWHHCAHLCGVSAVKFWLPKSTNYIPSIDSSATVVKHDILFDIGGLDEYWQKGETVTTLFGRLVHVHFFQSGMFSPSELGRCHTLKLKMVFRCNYLRL